MKANNPGAKECDNGIMIRWKNYPVKNLVLILNPKSNLILQDKAMKNDEMNKTAGLVWKS